MSPAKTRTFVVTYTHLSTTYITRIRQPTTLRYLTRNQETRVLSCTPPTGSPDAASPPTPPLAPPSTSPAPPTPTPASPVASRTPRACFAPSRRNASPPPRGALAPPRPSRSPLEPPAPPLARTERRTRPSPRRRITLSAPSAPGLTSRVLRSDSRRVQPRALPRSSSRVRRCARSRQYHS